MRVAGQGRAGDRSSSGGGDALAAPAGKPAGPTRPDILAHGLFCCQRLVCSRKQLRKVWELIEGGLSKANAFPLPQTRSNSLPALQVCVVLTLAGDGAVPSASRRAAAAAAAAGENLIADKVCLQRKARTKEHRGGRVSARGLCTVPPMNQPASQKFAGVRCRMLAAAEPAVAAAAGATGDAQLSGEAALRTNLRLWYRGRRHKRAPAALAKCRRVQSTCRQLTVAGGFKITIPLLASGRATRKDVPTRRKLGHSFLQRDCLPKTVPWDPRGSGTCKDTGTPVQPLRPGCGCLVLTRVVPSCSTAWSGWAGRRHESAARAAA